MTRILTFCPHCKQYSEPEKLSIACRHQGFPPSITYKCPICGVETVEDFRK